jgi:hypothetical protein
MLELAAGMPRLRAFVFVSTYYVSNFKPYNSLVAEEVHQLTLQLTGRLVARLRLVSSQPFCTQQNTKHMCWRMRLYKTHNKAHVCLTCSLFSCHESTN